MNTNRLRTCYDIKFIPTTKIDKTYNVKLFNTKWLTWQTLSSASLLCIDIENQFYSHKIENIYNSDRHFFAYASDIYTVNDTVNSPGMRWSEQTLLRKLTHVSSACITFSLNVYQLYTCVTLNERKSISCFKNGSRVLWQRTFSLFI
jgi:hypothetical protein